RPIPPPPPGAGPQGGRASPDTAAPGGWGGPAAVPGGPDGDRRGRGRDDPGIVLKYESTSRQCPDRSHSQVVQIGAHIPFELTAAESGPSLQRGCDEQRHQKPGADREPAQEGHHSAPIAPLSTVPRPPKRWRRPLT